MKSQISIDYENGISINKLKDKYRISKNIIREILEEEGIKIKSATESIPTTITKEQITTILELYNKKISISEILETAKISRTSLYRILRDNNIDPNDTAVMTILMNHINEIKELISKNLSTHELAIKYNVSNDSIRRFLHTNNIEFRISKLHGKDEEIINLYIKGDSLSVLAKRFSASKQGISYILKKHNIPTRSAESSVKDYTTQIISQYKEGDSSSIIGDSLNVGPEIIRRVLIQNDVDRREHTDSSRIYTLNENFFDNIDSSNKAYFLGFLYADGNVSKENNTIRLRLAEKDKYILDKLNIIIGSNRPLYYRPEHIADDYLCQPSYELNISSKHMKEQVIKLGLVPAKTFIITFPEWLDSNLYSSFILGAFDGDGSIAYDKNTDVYGFALAGTEQFLLKIQEILMKECNLNKTQLITVGNIKILAYGGSKQLIRIKDFLYKDSTICLQRKKDVFERIIIKQNEIDTQQVINAFYLFSTNREIAEDLGISYKSVQRHLKKVGIERGLHEINVNDSEVIRLYTKELKTAQEIGNIYGCSHTSIYRVLMRNNILIRDSHSNLTTMRKLEPFKDEIINLYVNEKKSAQFIADTYDVNQNTLIKFLIENNVEIRTRSEAFKSVIAENKEQVLDLFLNKYYSTEAIAREFNVTGAVVRKFLKRWGVR